MRAKVAPTGSDPAPASAGEGFARSVIAWQQKHGRHHFPWQASRDAYRIWLSEIMLQQTQVATVIPYFERFVARFPDVAALAQAPQDAVMALWSGLGYYSRARNLHRAAQMVLREHDGRFPTDPMELERLPGVGRSTAAAISVFAAGNRAAILDGNVQRVLARCFGIAGWPGETAVKARLWALADALLPAQDLEAYTQGLMDLGAGVCTRSRPACSACPLLGRCVAHAEGRESTLPTPRPRRHLPQRHTWMLLVSDAQGRLLLHRRPSRGIWGGLWSLPEVDDAGALNAWLAATGLVLADTPRPLPAMDHAFTHFRLRIEPLHVPVLDDPALTTPGNVWEAPATALARGLPAPVRALIESLPRP